MYIYVYWYYIYIFIYIYIYIYKDININQDMIYVLKSVYSDTKLQNVLGKTKSYNPFHFSCSLTYQNLSLITYTKYTNTDHFISLQMLIFIFGYCENYRIQTVYLHFLWNLYDKFMFLFLYTDTDRILGNF